MTLAEILPLGPHGGLVIAVVAGAANFLTVLTVIRALAPKDLLTARARSHARRRRELRTQRLAPRRAPRSQPSIGYAKRLLERLKLDRGSEAKKVGDLLTQAGWRTPDATTVFLTLRLVSPFVVGLAGYMLAPMVLHQTGTLRLVAGAGALLAGAYLPTLMLKNAVKRRYAKITKGLPDALDLFVICSEAGLSLDAAMTRVGREIGGSWPELSDELGLTAIELGFLPNRRDALVNLAKRVDMGPIRGLVNTLVQTEKYGTPLAQALRVLSAEFRDTRMMKAEEKAARLPATLTIPMISFILPPLFIVLIGPAIIQALSASYN